MEMYIGDIKIFNGEDLRKFIQNALKNVKNNRVEVNGILKSFENSNCVKAVLGERKQGSQQFYLV